MSRFIRRAASLVTTVLSLCPFAHATDVDDACCAFAGNVALTSDYIFRGLTQTWAAAAIQGGGDLVTKSGFAVGFWGSSISEKSYPGALLEADVYGSYGQSFNDDWSWRLGLYGYIYPKGNLDNAGLSSRSFDTFEANAALTWKWLSLKYSRSLTDYFGIDVEQGYRGDSRGTAYVEFNVAIPLSGKWNLSLHGARTDIPTRLAIALTSGGVNPDYTDVGATLKYQFHSHWSASVVATYADNEAFYGRIASFSRATDTRNTGGVRGFVVLQDTF